MIHQIHGILFDNEPFKQSLEKFAKFPNLTSFENNEPRLLLVAIDIQQCVPVVFNSYEKEYGTRYSEPEVDNKLSQLVKVC